MKVIQNIKMTQETIDDKCEHAEELKQTKKLYLCNYPEGCKYQVHIFSETYCKKHYTKGDVKSKEQ